MEISCASLKPNENSLRGSSSIVKHLQNQCNMLRGGLLWPNTPRLPQQKLQNSYSHELQQKKINTRITEAEMTKFVACYVKQGIIMRHRVPILIFWYHCNPVAAVNRDIKIVFQRFWKISKCSCPVRERHFEIEWISQGNIWTCILQMYDIEYVPQNMQK